MNNELAQFTAAIAAMSESPADAIVWRDIECHEGGELECVEGSAEQLAAKVIALGWVIDNPHEQPAAFNLNCAKCAETRPETDEFWLEAEHRYAEWKAARSCEG